MRARDPMLTLLVVLGIAAFPASGAQQPPAPPPQPLVVATVVDSVKGTTLVVSPSVSLVFAPGAFSDDTAVTAKLDAAAGRLTLSSRGGELKSKSTQINLDLSQLPTGLQLEYQHRLDAGARFVGVVTDVVEKPRVQFTATTETGLEPVTIVPNTILLLSVNGGRAQQDKWSNLMYGDAVRVRYLSGRRADLIEASRVTGEAVVHHVTGNRVALVEGGKPLAINPQARLEDADGKPFKLETLELDDKISYRQNPDTEEAWYLKRTVKAADAALRLVLNHDGDKPLLPGDRIRLRASGPPGGTVTLDLLNVESDLQAKELRALPGTYELLYTVPRGVKVAETQVVARLRLPNGRSNAVVAEKPVRFAGVTGAAATPTPDKPAAQPAQKLRPPVVTSPAEGEAIGDTLVVSGTTAANQKVKIVIDYVVTKAIFKLGEGRLPEVEATADAKGAFRSADIDARVKSLIKGDTDYTITVTAIGANGEESEPTVVKVRRVK